MDPNRIEFTNGIAPLFTFTKNGRYLDVKLVNGLSISASSSVTLTSTQTYRIVFPLGEPDAPGERRPTIMYNLIFLPSPELIEAGIILQHAPIEGNNEGVIQLSFTNPGVGLTPVSFNAGDLIAKAFATYRMEFDNVVLM